MAALTLAKRPAEASAGLAGAVAALVVAAFGVSDPAILAPLVVVVGAVPAAVTFLVELIRGRANEEGL